MTVIDASAMLEALVGRDADHELIEALATDIDAPHLVDVEVLSALRGLVLAGKLAPESADDARREHFALTITRNEVDPLTDRIWQLRHQFTAYDANYLALAEALDTPLLTCDAKLASGGHDVEVRVFPRDHTAGADRGHGRVPDGAR